MKRISLSNTLFLAAIVGFAVLGWTAGLLGLIALFLMLLVLDLQAVRKDARIVADVFRQDVDIVTQEKAEQMTEAVMARLRQEMRSAARWH